MVAELSIRNGDIRLVLGKEKGTRRPRRPRRAPPLSLAVKLRRSKKEEEAWN